MKNRNTTGNGGHVEGSTTMRNRKPQPRESVGQVVVRDNGAVTSPASVPELPPEPINSAPRAFGMVNFFERLRRANEKRNWEEIAALLATRERVIHADTGVAEATEKHVRQLERLQPHNLDAIRETISIETDTTLQKAKVRRFDADVEAYKAKNAFELMQIQHETEKALARKKLIDAQEALKPKEEKVEPPAVTERPVSEQIEETLQRLEAISGEIDRGEKDGTLTANKRAVLDQQYDYYFNKFARLREKELA